MRSRYSAFVLRLERYLLDTWHSKTRPPSVEFIDNQRWLGLKIVEQKQTGPNTAEVEFIARYRIGGASAARLHERSRFIRDNERWFYIDGEIR